jgi:RNA polymerase sigma factor (TIGR02999 family)
MESSSNLKVSHLALSAAPANTVLECAGYTPQMPDPGDITDLLRRWRNGNRDAENDLFAIVMPNLRRLAHYFMKGERKGHSLQATELVNQVYLKLIDAKDRDWQSRKHFYAIAARAMRRYLIDHARGRPKNEFVALSGVEHMVPAGKDKIDQAIVVDSLLEQLSQSNPDWCTVVELKFFLGLNDEEAAEMLGVKLRTMQRMWHDARIWLFERMEAGRAKQSVGR